jgi:hypothetical protein
MDTRKIASLTGWLMVVTFVTSIPAYFILYAPARNNPDSITGAGADPTASVALGAVLEHPDHRQRRHRRSAVRALQAV